jgi:hypothetical protein
MKLLKEAWKIVRMTALSADMPEILKLRGKENKDVIGFALPLK